MAASMIAAAGELHGRAVREWIGRTPDTPAPGHVKLRVLLRHTRKCHWTGKVIRPADNWDLEHVVALINGGQNREANMAPILRGKAHREKSRQDVSEMAKVNRIRKRHYGTGKRSSFATARNGPFKAKIGGGVERRT